MTSIFDLAIFLGGDGVIFQVFFGMAWTGQRDAAFYVGQKVGSLPGFIWNAKDMTLSYEGETYGYTSFGIPQGTCFLIKKEDIQKKLMAAALDASPDIIQLYTKSGGISFFNQTSRRFLGIPLEDSVEGQALLDVFSLDPDYSSVFTALKSENPVHHRYDSYKSTTGKELMTVVEAEPVFDEKGSLIGAFSVERDMKSVKTQLQVLHEVEAILMRHLTEDFTVKSDAHYTFDDFIGSSSVLRETLRLAQKMALRDMNILIEGETGTGKEILAQSIHQYSSRKKEKFIAVNCAAFPETLIDSMLFGTVKGAFTGATDKIGLIEAANHGTLFLDEVNSMSPLMQAKLLRVLQEKTLQRIGSTRSIPIDVRILSSSNEDVYRLSQEGKMRQDLFYRLSSLILEIPALRRRMEDLPELVQYFIDHHPHLTAQPIHELTSKFWRRLLEHDWPGNVRELFHILSYAISVSQNGILDERDFPSYFLRHSAPLERKETGREEMDPVPAAVGRTFAEQMDDFERNLLWNTYLSCGKNVTKAAEALGLTRQNFQYHMKKFQETESGDRLLDK